MAVRAFVLCCTHKPSPAPSSSELLGRQVLCALAQHNVVGELVRVVDHRVPVAPTIDQADSDEWPDLRAKLLDAQIVVIATPIWLGQPASVCKLVLDRLNAEFAETDRGGRMLTFGKVGAVVVVGEQDIADRVGAEVLQALNDVGFSIPAAATTYWVGGVDGVDHHAATHKATPTAATATLARHAAHLATVLQARPYPAG